MLRGLVARQCRDLAILALSRWQVSRTYLTAITRSAASTGDVRAVSEDLGAHFGAKLCSSTHWNGPYLRS